MRRQATFKWFEGRRRPPSEYEEVTQFFSTWGIPFLPDQEGSPLAGKTAQPFLMNPETTGIHEYMKPHTQWRSIYWEGFRDPHQVYYKTYNQMQWEAEEALDRVLSTAEAAGHFERLSPGYREVLGRVWPPLRFVEWGVVKAMQDVAHYTPSSPVDACATFQVADGLRFVQRNVTLSLRLGFSDHRERWLGHPEWQPMRKTVEELLAVRDWGEAVVAANLALKEGMKAVVFAGLWDLAEEERDLVLLHLLQELGRDLDRHLDWARALADYLGQDPKHGEANRSLTASWLASWRPRVEEALRPLASLLPGGGEKLTAWREAWSRNGAI